MKLAALQMDVVWHEREANYAKAEELARSAREQGADLLLLPEMFATGFSMDVQVTREPLHGPTPSFLRSLARDLGVTVVGGFALERPGEKPWNVALSVGPDGQDLALYAKTHLIGVLGENGPYAPGSKAVSFPWGPLRVGCAICYDLRFPELFRALTDHCRLMVVVASWPSARQTHWDILLRARAIEGQCFVAGVNRVGTGNGLHFWGGSAIVDPLGEVLAQGGREEGLVAAPIDPSKVEAVRRALPFLKDRRHEPFAEPLFNSEQSLQKNQKKVDKNRISAISERTNSRP